MWLPSAGHTQQVSLPEVFLLAQERTHILGMFLRQSNLELPRKILHSPQTRRKQAEDRITQVPPSSSKGHFPFVKKLAMGNL